MKFKILGHRGSGASDAPFNQQRDKEAGITRHDENTMRSFEAALFNSADGIETDLIQSENGIVLVHANDYSQHIMDEKYRAELTRQKAFIGDMTLGDISLMEIGRQSSEIPTLSMLLHEMKKFPGVFLNLELKGVQDTRPSHQQPSHFPLSLAAQTALTIESSNFSPNKIRFSSFAISYLKEMAEICDEADLGMLFDLPQDQGGDVDLPMFCDRPDVYQAFTVAAMEKVLEDIPTLTAVHPEIQSLNNRNVGFAARHGLNIATWGWKEYSPFGNGEGNQRFAKALTNAFTLCAKHKISELAIITDHVRDVRQFIQKNTLDRL